MRRGDVYLVNLDPAIGSEATKVRPAVIVSNDAGNAATTRLGRGTVTIAPLTTNTIKVYPFQVHVPAGEAGLVEDSKVQCEQIRTVDARRLRTYLGRLEPRRVEAVDRALRVHLAL